jgi:tripartite-type tricarboxylate transporter receptor subunit TctC
MDRNLKMKKWIKASFALLAGLCFIQDMAWPQSFPARPLKFIVPFTAGSGTDIIARVYADAISKSISQPIIIDNKPGAGGTIAAASVAKSEPDGYTLLIHSSGHALNPAIYPNLPYDTLKDLTGISPMASLPNVMVVSPTRGWKTLADVVHTAKANPGKFNYASAGIGSATHLNAEKFRLKAGIDAVHVPFKGTPEALSDVIGGRNDWFFAPLSSALPLIKEGKLQALAVSSPQRNSSLPNVPTTTEAGIAGSEYVFWVGMIAPSGVSAAVIKKLNDEIAKAAANLEVKDRLNKLAAEPMWMTADNFNQFIKAETEIAAQIAKAANIKAN